MRATAVLGGHPHTRWAAPVDREQGGAGSLHPEGQHRPTCTERDPHGPPARPPSRRTAESSYT